MPSDTTTSEDAEQDPSYSIPPRPEVEPPQEPVLTGDEATDAVKVATYFMNLYPYVLGTGDVRSWEKLSHPECGFCASTLELVNSFSESEWIETSVRVSDEEVFGVSGGDANYRVDLLIERTDLVHHDGNSSETVPGGEYSAVVGLTVESGVWSVHSFDILAASEFGTGL